uniref:Uncharacterized protein n=1 Tax=Arundo donax TaxID=35708 RepID=A0A0A9TY17_ARUDO
MTNPIFMKMAFLPLRLCPHSSASSCSRKSQRANL